MKIAFTKLGRYFKRLLIVLICAGAAVAAMVLLINQYVITSVKDRIVAPSETYLMNADCILVLGAGVNGENPSGILKDRLEQGIDLYENQSSDRLLMSGDHGRKSYDEVKVMKQFAMDYGIPSEHVFMDHAGFSTYESMYRARDVFQAKKVILVSQEYHLYRALYIAGSMGLDAYGVPTNPRKYGGERRRELREILARNKDFFTSIFKPLPKYLGDAIPVSGNGDATND